MARANIDSWFYARVFDAVSRFIAEAIYSNRSFHDVWNGYQAEGDLSSVVRDASLAHIADENINAAIDRVAALSACMVENPSVWAAVVALAQRLPVAGRMKGTKAVSCITSVIPESELIELFADGINRLREIESKINDAEVVLATKADGSQSVIKGKQVIAERVKEAQQTVEAELIRCTFPVFGETLWRAFGDGALSAEAP
jgi:hypothetical protein